jgi:hypothetical protein
VVEAKYLAGLRERVGEPAPEHRLDRVEPVPEGGHHAEVASPAAYPPEEVPVLLLAGRQEPAVGGHYVRGDEVVAGEAVLAVEPAEAAPEREARYAGHRDYPQRGRQPERLRLVVELAQGQPGLGFGGASGGVYADALHGREVEHQPAVAHRLAGDAVPAAADGERQVVGAGELDPPDHVGHPQAADDKGGAPVHHAVEDRPSGVVAVVLGANQLAPYTGRKPPDGRLIEGLGQGQPQGVLPIHHNP